MEAWSDYPVATERPVTSRGRGLTRHSLKRRIPFVHVAESPCSGELTLCLHSSLPVHHDNRSLMATL